MMDYIRWLFKLDFCTPRYVITREMVMDKLKVGWSIRAMRYEEKILRCKEESLVKKCWREKEVKVGWIRMEGRGRYYNRNG